MRHEQATAYAADGWARIDRHARRVLRHGRLRTDQCRDRAVRRAADRQRGRLSLGPASDARRRPRFVSGGVRRGNLPPFSKYANACSTGRRISFDTRGGVSPGDGAAAGAVRARDIPTNVLYHQEEENDQVPGAKSTTSTSCVRKATRDRSSGRRTAGRAETTAVIVGGDGVFWSGGGRGAAELAELTNTPVYTRRAGQGAVPEDHPLAVRGAWKKPFTGRADVVIAVGFRFWSGEKFGQPPTWTDKATYVQIDATPLAGRLASAGRGGDRRRSQARAAATHRRRQSAARLDFAKRKKNRPGSAKSPRPAETFEPNGPRARGEKVAATCRSIPTGLIGDLVGGARQGRDDRRRQLHALGLHQPLV